ncbi:nischarin-like [Corticium candelabrum]|uniref:nischarin-like n=1 Tax=Corticium candelabrum TaxID=121492 RepID=UPI002E26EE4B|nr:nischarin-like [Corticium candelabrum]
MASVVARWEESPRPLLDFVQYDEHSVVGVTMLLTKAVIDKGERMLRSDQMVEFTPQQLHCITQRLTTEAPTYDTSSKNPASDIGHLFDFVHQVKKLKVQSIAGDTTNEVVVGAKGGFIFDLSIFKSLEVLALHEVDPALIRGIEGIQPQLRKLTVHFCANPLQTVLVTSDLWNISSGSGSYMPDVCGNAPCWTSLKYANLRCNEIKTIDPAIRLLVNVVTLDLSQNLITEIENLDIPQLMILNLSNNRISSLVGIESKLGNVANLNLSHNRIKSLDGIGRLYSVLKLDVSMNAISDLQSLRGLGRLPCLESLKLEDNPIATMKQYRQIIVGIMQLDVLKQLKFDGIQVTKKEMCDLEKFRALALSVIGPGESSSPAPTPVQSRESRLVQLRSDNSRAAVTTVVESVEGNSETSGSRSGELESCCICQLVEPTERKA